jgi:hypothetical protein
LTATQPEMALLLLCASPVKGEANAAGVRELLNHDLDWSFLRTLVKSHRLLPLLYWELKSIRPDIIPALLAKGYEESIRNSLFLTSALFRILDLFERERIPAIPFKGPTLAVSAYNNLALRSFGDLDVLIRTEDVWRARDLLLRKGYVTKLTLKPGRENAYLHSYDELVLHGKDEYPLVELHWAIVPPYFSVSLETAALWERVQKVTLGNRTVPSLHPGDLFLVLCLHGSKHCWSDLALVCDVAWLITANTLPWALMLGRSRDLGVHRMVLLACFLAFQILGVPLAEPVARDIADDPAVPALAEEIIRLLFGLCHDEQAMILRSVLFHMRMRERPLDRARYFVRLATRPGIEDWQLINLPGPLSFLYSVLRLPRLAFKYRSRVP